MGAGAIGCFVGGKLATGGHEVTLLGRAPLMDAVATDGLTLQHPKQPTISVTPQVVTSLANLTTQFDYILLTMKAPQVPQAIVQLRESGLDVRQTQFVTLQNGVGSEAWLVEQFGSAQVIAATITIPIQLPQTGVIAVSKPKGGLGVAPIKPGNEYAVKQLATALNQVGLNTVVYYDYRAMKWSKLLLNMVNNATSAILNQPPSDIIAHPGLFDLEIGALREAYAVMQVMGVPAVSLPGYPADWLGRLLAASWLPLSFVRRVLRPFLSSGRGTKMPSLQIDLAAGRAISEVTALNGAVVRYGYHYQVSTPINLTLTNILTSIVQADVPWDRYQNQPEKLVALSKNCT